MTQERWPVERLEILEPRNLLGASDIASLFLLTNHVRNIFVEVVRVHDDVVVDGLGLPRLHGVIVATQAAHGKCLQQDCRQRSRFGAQVNVSSFELGAGRRQVPAAGQIGRTFRRKFTVLKRSILDKFHVVQDEALVDLVAFGWCQAGRRERIQVPRHAIVGGVR